MAKKKVAAKKKPKVEEVSFLERARSFYRGVLDKVAAEEGMISGADVLSLPRMSSGSLTMDLMMGGGLAPGWYQFSGNEQSAKTTNILAAFGESIKVNMLDRQFVDSENALNRKYAKAVMHFDGPLKELFGEKDEDDNWEIQPIVYHSVNNSLESVFNALSRSLRRLPDKTYDQKRKQWYYIYRRTTEDKARMKALGLEPDPKLSDARRAVCPIPPEMGGIQALYAIDSLPALIPDIIGEDEKEGGGVGLQARKYAEHLPKIVGLLQRKYCCTIVVNHIGEKPMAQGDPRYEKGGNSPKLYSMVRFRFTEVIPNKDHFTRDKDNYQVCIEESVEIKGGYDRYAFKNIENTKNKFGIPKMKGKQRIWFRDANGKPRGICPVYDFFYYAKETGQLDGQPQSKLLTIKMAGTKPVKVDGWLDLKKLILTELKSKSEYKKLWKSMFGRTEPIYFIAKSRKQNKTFLSQELFALNERTDDGDDGDAEDDDE